MGDTNKKIKTRRNSVKGKLNFFRNYKNTKIKAFRFKHEVGDQDMASLQSWLGLITFCLPGLQVNLSFLLGQEKPFVFSDNIPNVTVL
jgi:hypothetical protein